MVWAGMGVAQVVEVIDSDDAKWGWLAARLHHFLARRHHRRRVGKDTVTRGAHGVGLLPRGDLLLLLQLLLDLFEAVAPTTVQVRLQQVVRHRRRVKGLAAAHQQRRPDLNRATHRPSSAHASAATTGMARGLARSSICTGICSLTDAPSAWSSTSTALKAIHLMTMRWEALCLFFCGTRSRHPPKNHIWEKFMATEPRPSYEIFNSGPLPLVHASACFRNRCQ